MATVLSLWINFVLAIPSLITPLLHCEFLLLSLSIIPGDSVPMYTHNPVEVHLHFTSIQVQCLRTVPAIFVHFPFREFPLFWFCNLPYQGTVYTNEQTTITLRFFLVVHVLGPWPVRIWLIRIPKSEIEDRHVVVVMTKLKLWTLHCITQRHIKEDIKVWKLLVIIRVRNWRQKVLWCDVKYSLNEFDI